MPDTTSLQLALLLARRAVYEFQSTTAPDEVAELITASGVDRGKADALAWSGSADLSPTEIDALAAGFCFHRDLLATLFRPVSPEVLATILMEVEERHLDSPLKCDECAQFADRIDFVIQSGCAGDHGDLIFDLLGHLRVAVNSALEINPLLEDDRQQQPLLLSGPAALREPVLLPSTLNPVEDEEFDQLADVFSSLDAAARARLLAFAYKERAEALSGKALGQFDVYARLRSSHLTVQARRAFDAIAGSPSGELSLKELVEQLGVGDGRALGQLQRSVKASIDALAACGYPLADEPLRVVRPRPGETRLFLSPSALVAWRALLDSERESGSGSRHSRAES